MSCHTNAQLARGPKTLGSLLLSPALCKENVLYENFIPKATFFSKIGCIVLKLVDFAATD